MLLSEFLIERLVNSGVRHVFGVPGDYIQEFYQQLWNSDDIEVVNNTDEAHSGFAADAYARVNGVGCAVVTYNVGAAKLINAVQCAYAERSPLIVISGAPSSKERSEVLPFMDSIFSAQRDIFAKITCAAVVLDDLTRAGYLIDSAFEALKHYKRPIYIELPRDVVSKSVSYDVYKQGTPVAPLTDTENLREAVEEVESWLRDAKKPVIVAGVELARCGLGNQVVRFAEKNQVPITATLLSKSVVDERHPLYAGVYSGTSSKETVRELVDSSDCLLMLGVMHTDVTNRFFPSKFTKRNVVAANIDGLQVKNHGYAAVQFIDFCKSLLNMDLGTENRATVEMSMNRVGFRPQNKAITVTRFFEKVNSILTEDMAVVCDIGDSLYGAVDLAIPEPNRFLSPAFYTSMGVAIPGGLGVQTALPNVRPIIIVGDGAAQMSVLELGTMVRRKLNPVVFVLNNGGYATERTKLDAPFNEIANWKYQKVTDLIGGGTGVEVENELDLDREVHIALDSKQLSVINVRVGRDVSPGLRRVVKAMRGDVTCK